jgi:protein ImuB
VSTLWACFALPELALEGLGIGQARAGIGRSDIPSPQSDSRPSHSPPFAVHDGASQRPSIVCANAAARAAGIRAGMALAQAQALLPNLIAQRHDPSAQSRRLELLAALAYGFSSQVVLEPPDAVLLEIGASRSLFGDWKDIERALRARLAELGHRAVLAAAPTPAAARVLAGLADGYAVAKPEHLARVLARVPIGSARLSAEHTEELRRIGVRTLGDVFVLPRAALARRFGEGLLQALDWLRGTRIDSRISYRPPDRFERRLEFDYGIAHQDALRFPLQRLARELAAFLQARDGGVLRFVLRFEHDPHDRGDKAGAAATMLEVGLRKPCRDTDALFEAARQALERVALPAPAHALALIAEDLPPFAPELRDLFDPGLRGSLDLDGLAERLRARLGDGAVRELALHADHRPERAWRIADGRAAYPKSPQVIPPRPLWLLPKPVPFRGRIVRFVEAIERVETGWWDGDDTRRDYAIADLETGQRAWLYRTVDTQAPAARDAGVVRSAALAQPCNDPQGWMLHGWFA